MATTKVRAELVDLNEATSESGLKIPSGTELNRPTAVAGQIRNNTNETSNGSASCEEYYNGTAWKKINNVALPVYFRTVTYTGNGGTQAITGVGFQPDFVWIKQRNGTTWHNLQDSTRGSTNHLYSNATNSQDTTANGVTSFDSDGFTLGGGNGFNGSGQSMVAWCWKANGGTTSSNTDGTITSTVQANSDAGFSIVKWTGTGSNLTVGTGLTTAADLIITKAIGTVSPGVGEAWPVFHSSLVNNNIMYLDQPYGATSGNKTSVYQDPTTTSTTFGVETWRGINQNGVDMISYCFHSVNGFSKFGSYTGNGTAGQAITTVGFEPTWVLIKSTVGTSNWLLYDTTRGITSGGFLNPDNSDPETADSLSPNITVTATGFTITSGGVTQGLNSNGNLYIYAAFK